MTLLLTDGDLDSVAPGDAVAWMLEALQLRASGALSSPPRVHASLVSGKIVMTAGQTATHYGYRVYDTLPTTAGQQIVAVHDASSGDIAAVHVGNQLGAMRTGALGGVAASLLGPQGPAHLAIIGAGHQAWAQLWAISGATDIAHVAITSRSEDSRKQLAAQAQELGIDARPVSSVREATEGADIVVLATNSSTPVLDATWLKDDVLVTTLGPKQVGRAEFDLALLDGATVVTTDSPDQLRAYDPPALVADAGLSAGVVDLATLAAADRGQTESSVRTGRRVYLSVGLAGTEVHMLARIYEQRSSA